MPSKLKEKPIIQSLESKELGKRIAIIRKQKGITQVQLAEAIGIDQRLISSYEVGRVTLSAEMLFRLAKALQVPADEILGISESENNEITAQPNLRFTRRFNELEKLPEQKKKAILKTLDDLIRANM
jgi:transcriptional regulator with XRE-family HTH domain